MPKLINANEALKLLYGCNGGHGLSSLAGRVEMVTRLMEEEEEMVEKEETVRVICSDWVQNTFTVKWQDGTETVRTYPSGMLASCMIGHYLPAAWFDKAQVFLDSADKVSEVQNGEDDRDATTRQDAAFSPEISGCGQLPETT